MISLVVNSYYRQGDDIVYKMLELSNLNAVVLHEPLHPNLFNIIENLGFNVVDQVYRMKVWVGYSKLDYFTLMKMKKHHKDFTVVLNFNEVKNYLDVLHNIPKEVMFKTTRCHFILKDIKQTYNCKTIHVLRNPANTWLDHFDATIKYNPDLFWKYTLNDKYWSEVGKLFFLEPLFNVVAKKLGIEKVNNCLERFVITWTYCNYHAVISCDTPLIYEVLVTRCVDYINYLNRRLGRVVFSEAFAHLPRIETALERPTTRDRLNNLISKIIIEYGLEKYYKKIFEVVSSEMTRFSLSSKYYPLLP